MNGLKTLSGHYLTNFKERHPGFPDYGIPKLKYSDKDTRGLTKCILDYVRFVGGYAVRINTQGQYNEKLGMWTKSQTARGTADIHLCVNGHHISVEIKIGRDIQSEYQKGVEEQVRRAGGHYFIARNFQDFFEFLEPFLKKNGGEK